MPDQTTTGTKVWVFWDYDCCCGGGSTASGPVAVFHDETHADLYQQAHPSLKLEVLTDTGHPGTLHTRYTATTNFHSPTTLIVNGVARHQWHRSDHDTVTHQFGTADLAVNESPRPAPGICLGGSWSVTAVADDPGVARRACNEAVVARLDHYGVGAGRLRAYCPACSDKDTNA